MNHPTADWTRLQDRYYRKTELYNMVWKNMDLKEYHFAAGLYGGPIALVKKSKLTHRSVPSYLRSELFVYSSSGVRLATIPWEKGTVISLGWTEQEQLLVVAEDGSVLMYSILGSFIKTFSFGKEAQEFGVIDCKFWGSGLVVLTGDFRFHSIMNLSEPRVRTLPAIVGIDSPPISWTLIEPKYTLGRHVEVLVAWGKTAYVIDPNEAQDQLLERGPFTQMTVSPNGKLLALHSDEGLIWVVSTDFQKSFSEFFTKTSVAPISLHWCGSDSVVAYYDGILLMVGPFGDWKKFAYDSYIHLLSEFDGVRIISDEFHEFLQRVPSPVEETFAIGSVFPSSMLYDASDHFERKSQKADELIRSIKNGLSEAVSSCIEAAAHSYRPLYQKSLLRAASFGKCFIEFYNPDRFVSVCRYLRVLNAVRDPEIGVGITFAQFEQLTPEILVNRLVSRNLHFLAFRVCEFLQMKTDRILVHWACGKVKANENSESLCSSIVKRIGHTKGVSFAEISRAALDIGKHDLAAALLENEPIAADQIPLFLSMKEDERALDKAIESGDTDLIWFVLLHLKEKLSLGSFFRLIHDRPIACELLIKYCKNHDLELLKSFYYQDDRSLESADHTVKEAYMGKGLSERLKQLKVARGMYLDAKDESHMVKYIDDQIKLLYAQEDMEKKYRISFLDLSLSETVKKCLLDPQLASIAVSLKKDFKMSDRQFWWVKIQALADRKNWKELETFSKSKKSPIGYEPFIEACLKANMKTHAMAYISRLEPKNRIPWYLNLQAYREAMDTAFHEKSISDLEDIKNSVYKRPEIVAEIEGLINQLTLKR